MINYSVLDYAKKFALEKTPYMLNVFPGENDALPEKLFTEAFAKEPSKGHVVYGRAFRANAG